MVGLEYGCFSAMTNQSTGVAVFVVWLIILYGLQEHSLQGQLRSPFDLLVSPNLNFQTVYRGSLFGIFFTNMQRSLQG